MLGSAFRRTCYSPVTRGPAHLRGLRDARRRWGRVLRWGHSDKIRPVSEWMERMEFLSAWMDSVCCGRCSRSCWLRANSRLFPWRRLRRALTRTFAALNLLN